MAHVKGTRRKKLEIFSDMDPKNPEHERPLKRVCDILEPVKFSAGEVIIQEGDIGDTLYILYDGTVPPRYTSPRGLITALFQLIFFKKRAIIDIYGYKKKDRI